jgi:hypothetical protein
VIQGVDHDLIGTLWILDSSTGAVICAIHDDRGHSVGSYIFVDDGNGIITTGCTSTGRVSKARCWCAVSGRRIKAHWANSYLATTVCANAAAHKILFVDCSGELGHRFDCVNSAGELLCNGCLYVPGSVFGFVDEDIVICLPSSLGPGLPVTLANFMTGTVSNFAVDTDDEDTIVYSIVENGASKILIGHRASVYVLSTRHGGKIMKTINDSQRSNESIIRCTCATELDCVILL